MQNKVSVVTVNEPAKRLENLSFGTVFTIKGHSDYFMKQPRGNVDEGFIWAVSLNSGIRYAFNDSQHTITNVYGIGSTLCIEVA